MHGLFAAFIVLAMFVGTGEATGAQRTKPTQHSDSNAVVQTEAPQRGRPVGGQGPTALPV
jgi:hypothetical protein